MSPGTEESIRRLSDLLVSEFSDNGTMTAIARSLHVLANPVSATNPVAQQEIFNLRSQIAVMEAERGIAARVRKERDEQSLYIHRLIADMDRILAAYNESERVLELVGCRLRSGAGRELIACVVETHQQEVKDRPNV